MITFVAGTKAVAEEVNSNFNEVNNNIDSINSELSTSISNLETSTQTKLDNKADTDLTNCTRPYVESRTAVGGGVVEIWSDGYCVQTGVVTIPGYTTFTNVTITLEQSYKDENYIVLTQLNKGGAYWSQEASNTTNSAGSFIIGLYQTTGTGTTIASHRRFWRTEGYIR